MNTPLRRVALAVMGMIVLLLLNATYIQVVNADTYRSDPRNRRVLLDEYSRQRGEIIAGGLPVASSVETSGQLRFLRRYLDGAMYAPVTGYYSLRYGSGGMENAMDSVLNGSDGRLFVRRLS
ncbi:MAG: penicillin-binding protein 2, partial [Pseudonocardiaceae bacterium]